MACTTITTIDYFAKGSPVEVSSDADGYRGVWYIAKILDTPPPLPLPLPAPEPVTPSPTKRKYNKKGPPRFYLVEYTHLLSDEGLSSGEDPKPLTESVDSVFMRPLPPHDIENQVEAFQLSDVVDAFYLDGWWVGVIDQVMEDNKYSVYFDNPPDLLQFDRSELRVHLDWVKGKWVQPKNKMVIQQRDGTGSQKRRKRKQRKSVVNSCSKALVTVEECDGAGSTVDKMVIKEDGTSSQQRKRRKLRIIVKDTGKECDGAGRAVDKMIISEMFIDDEVPRITGESTEYQNVSTDVELSDANNSTKKAEMAVAKMPSNMADAVDRPPLDKLCLPSNALDSSYSSSRAVNQWKETNGTAVEIAVPDENQSFPFVKCSPILKAIQPMETLSFANSSKVVMKAVEAMNVYQTMLQKPHFRPLDKYNQMYREGLAIGYMVIFANVVEQTSKLQVNDPRSIFDSISEALVDLESHGFDIEIVRLRLAELQSIKERQEQLQEELKGFENQITERAHVQTKVMAEFNDVVKEIKALEEKKAMLVSTKERNAFEIGALKSRFDVLQEDIQNAQLNFESVAAAAW